MSAAVRIETFDSAAALGAAAAEVIVDLHRRAAAQGRGLVLGCPAGRSPLSTYRAFARRCAELQLDLSSVRIVMMDEYVERSASDWRWCEADAHFSCRGFAERELRQAVNAGLSPARQLPRESVHTPDPQDPAAYERLIESLGGIDLFLLASGASDGHVAFNPPGTPLDSSTRIVELAASTRADNLGTFPGFASANAVPSHGVTVGLGTIVRHSRAALLLLSGSNKHIAFERVRSSAGFDPAWPATVIGACNNGRILADRAAIMESREACVI